MVSKLQRFLGKRRRKSATNARTDNVTTSLVDLLIAVKNDQQNLVASKLTVNLMLKINTQNTVKRAYNWLKLDSVVIDNICAVRILYRDLSDSPFFGDNLNGLVSSGSECKKNIHPLESLFSLTFAQ